jgi:hypothetical protein
MGSMPYRMYGVCKKKLGVYWGLVDKISPAFELRNSGVPAVVIRSFQLRVVDRGHIRDRQASLCRGTADTLPRLAGSASVDVPRHCRHSPPARPCP